MAAYNGKMVYSDMLKYMETVYLFIFLFVF